jgi:hypothetical protein
MTARGSLDEWIEKIQRMELLPERDYKHLCEYVKELMLEESTVQQVSAPVTICGDIHGQFHDLLQLFETGGQCPQTSYIFLGDFVDRGYNSVETITLLLLLKARFPTRMTLLRGNHECRQITQVGAGRHGWVAVAVGDDHGGRTGGVAAPRRVLAVGDAGQGRSERRRPLARAPAAAAAERAGAG